MKILALQADNLGSGYVRIELPYTMLRTARGHTVKIASQFHPAEIPQYDVVVLQRPGNEWSLPMARWCQMWRIPLVIELDDLCWALPEWNPNHEMWTQEAYGIQQECLRLASATTVTTDSLAKEVSEFCPEAYVLPNYQDTSIYTVPDHDRSPVTIGWAGSHTHRNDLNILTGTIGRLIEQHPDTRLLTIGGYKPAEDALGNGIPPEKKEHLPWCEQMVYFTHLPKIDIGLCPIVPNKFNDSKSWNKVLEYGSVGAPSICSNTGPYPLFIKPDFGFLCNDERDFTLALEALLKDAQKRLAMGKRAREVAEENSIQKNVWRWEMALMDVIENTRRARYSKSKLR